MLDALQTYMRRPCGESDKERRLRCVAVLKNVVDKSEQDLKATGTATIRFPGQRYCVDYSKNPLQFSKYLESEPIFD
jgi:hypothetical protein